MNGNNNLPPHRTIPANVTDLGAIPRARAEAARARDEAVKAAIANKQVLLEVMTWGQRAQHFMLAAVNQTQNVMQILAEQGGKPTLNPNTQAQMKMNVDALVGVAGVSARLFDSCARMAAASSQIVADLGFDNALDGVAYHNPYSDTQYEISKGLLLQELDPNTWQPLRSSSQYHEDPDLRDEGEPEDASDASDADDNISAFTDI